MPSILINIVKDYCIKEGADQFTQNAVYFTLRGTNYAIWLRKMKRSLKGGRFETYYRIQTFYPLVDHKEMKKLESMTEYEISEGYSLFI